MPIVQPPCLRTHRRVCAECANKIGQLKEPYCARCSYPLSGEPGEARLCGVCAGGGQFRHIDRLIASGIYAGAMRDAICLMKFGKKEFLGRWFAARMVSWASANGVETGGYDCIVSVPMHPVKMRERGFDQSQVIAREIARLSGAAYAAGVIRRKRAGAVQSTLSKRDRLENVRNAFGVVRPEAVKGCRVLLVDDIFTTGATAEECARALIAAGARSVDVFVAARGVEKWN